MKLADILTRHFRRNAKLLIAPVLALLIMSVAYGQEADLQSDLPPAPPEVPEIAQTDSTDTSAAGTTDESLPAPPPVPGAPEASTSAPFSFYSAPAIIFAFLAILVVGILAHYFEKKRL